jgi:hypothetical protein
MEHYAMCPICNKTFNTMVEKAVKITLDRTVRYVHYSCAQPILLADNAPPPLKPNGDAQGALK